MSQAAALTATVRPARRDDLPDLLALFRHLNRDPAVLPADEASMIWNQMAATPGITVYVADQDARAVAMCTLIVAPNLGRGGRSIAFIENVATLPEFQRRGLGKAVIAAALDEAWAQNCYKAMLITGARDPGVLSFYQACGFDADGKTALQIRRL